MNRETAARKVTNALRCAFAMALLVFVSGCLTGSVRSQRVTRYRPNVRPFRPDQTAAVASPLAKPGHPSVSMSGRAGGNERPVARPAPGKPRPPVADTNTVNASSSLLRAGDQLTITILGVESITVKDVVDERGNVNLPMIGQMKLLGLTTSQAEKLIEKTYIDEGFFKRITVTVVAQKEDYFIHGQVMKAGRFPWTPDLTLLKALGAAGGFTPFAKESKIELQRGAQRLEYNAVRIGDGREPDPAIEPGDVIVVSRGFWK